MQNDFSLCEMIHFCQKYFMQYIGTLSRMLNFQLLVGRISIKHHGADTPPVTVVQI